MSAPAERITFRIERNVVLEALWFDQGWYDELRASGLNHEDALRVQLRAGVQEDPLSIMWESFGPGEELATEFMASVVSIDLLAAEGRYERTA